MKFAYKQSGPSGWSSFPGVKIATNKFPFETKTSSIAILRLVFVQIKDEIRLLLLLCLTKRGNLTICGQNHAQFILDITTSAIYSMRRHYSSFFINMYRWCLWVLLAKQAWQTYMTMTVLVSFTRLTLVLSKDSNIS